MLRDSPFETMKRLTVMGEDWPTSIGYSSCDSDIQPPPGRQFFGECGALPFRWDRKAATKKFDSAPAAFLYVRFITSSALRSAATSGSITPSSTIFHAPSSFGMPARGLLVGIVS